jgi:hypothetical protein
MWCEAPINENLSACAECNYQNPKSRPRSRHGRRVLLSLLVLPLMGSLALAARIEHGVMAAKSPQAVATVAAARPVQPQPVVSFADPAQEATWVDGQKSLGLMLGETTFTAFMSTGAGNVVSLCGNVKGTTGYQTPSGQRRYISVFGRLDGTVMETQDPSFEVLWNRACRGSSIAA